MLIDLTDYDSKKLELEIKGYEKAILEEKARIGNLEYMKLRHELTLIEKGITKEDVEKYIIDFVESSENVQEDLKELYKELNELIESKEDVEINDLTKILHYSTISISIIELEIEKSNEELKALRRKVLQLRYKQLELQKKKVDEIATERKYKELLKDE